MKTLIATVLIAASLLSTAAMAASPYSSDNGSYPTWAQKAFTDHDSN